MYNCRVRHRVRHIQLSTSSAQIWQRPWNSHKLYQHETTVTNYGFNPQKATSCSTLIWICWRLFKCCTISYCSCIDLLHSVSISYFPVINWHLILFHQMGHVNANDWKESQRNYDARSDTHFIAEKRSNFFTILWQRRNRIISNNNRRFTAQNSFKQL